MLWRLVRKIARLYSFIAIAVLGLMLASDEIASHQLNDDEALLAAFFPYGVLFGLVISWIFMKAGGLITLISLAGFYTLSYWQSSVWPDNELPLILSGAGPLFLLASFVKSIGRSERKKKKHKKRSRS